MQRHGGTGKSIDREVTDPAAVERNSGSTPIAVLGRTVSSRDAMAEIAADNLIAGLKGEPLRAWVNPEVATNRRKRADLG